MLSERNAALLTAELKKPDYDAISMADAEAFLFKEVAETATVDTGQRLSVNLLIDLLGPIKADAAVASIKKLLPNIADQFLNFGMLLSRQDVQDVLASVANDGGLLSDDKDAVIALASKQVSTSSPPRWIDRFCGSGTAELQKMAGVDPQRNGHDKLIDTLIAAKVDLAAGISDEQLQAAAKDAVAKHVIDAAVLDAARGGDEGFPHAVSPDEFQASWETAGRKV